MTEHDPELESLLQEDPYSHAQADEQGAYDDPYVEGGARKKQGKGRLAGCLAVLVALAVLLGGGFFAITKGWQAISDQFAGAGDYPGPGRGSVMFEVKDGDSTAEIGRNLKAAGVVKSVQAFTDAAADEPKALSIQVGAYQLQKEMRAVDALAILIDPGNLVKDTVTIPEGLRVTDILDILAAKTDFSRAEYEKVLAKPQRLGLPSYAGDDPEGYLFPATYDILPDDTPKSILRSMVKAFKRAAAEADLEGRAAELGYTPAELVTIASLLEAEARGRDMPKVARVVYNRLANDGAPTYGLLQIDATVNYALDRKLGVALTTDELEVDSPYNTYKYAGLPPGPIEAPGLAALKAAVKPADGDWYFYVTVNLRTGKTKFTADYDEFLQFKAEFQQYCETSDAC